MASQKETEEPAKPPQKPFYGAPVEWEELEQMEEESDLESPCESDNSSDTYDSAEEQAFIHGKDIILDGNDSDSDEEWIPPSQAKKRCWTSTGLEVNAFLSAETTRRTLSKSTIPPGSTATTKKKLRGRSRPPSPVSPEEQRRAPRQPSAQAQLSEKAEEDKWHDVTDEDEKPSLPPFQPKRTPGPQLIRTAEYSPLQLFQLFFSMSVVKSIVSNTNKYVKCRKKAGKKFKWTRLTVHEFYGFLALTVHMALVKVKSLPDYWSQKRGYRFDFPSSIMSRDRFFAISWNLHLSDPDKDAENMEKKGSPEYDRLFKIKPLYEQIRDACRTHFHPRRELSVDERMVASKARSALKQYMKDKPTKWGYKLFVLADSSNGYTSNFFVYEGKNNMGTGKGLGYESVMQLLDFSFLGRGYKIYMDSFYTSPTLLTDLLEESTVACGTIRTNQLGYPKTTENDLPKNAERGAIRWYRRDKLLFVKWKDTREVTMCSTIHQVYAGEKITRRLKTPDGVWKKEPVPIPTAIKEYNKYMGGVDLSDALLSYYQVLHKTKKWYKTFFFHFIDIAIVNSFILHKEMARLHDQKSLTQKQFRETLQVELQKLSKISEEDSEEEEQPSQPRRAVMCLPAFYSTDATGGRRVCELCKEAERKVKTPVYCTKCEVPLCHVPSRNCFNDWHEKGYHKKI